MASPDRIEAAYDALVGDEDGRVCKDIPDSACTALPGNFFRQLGAIALTKLGDALASPKTTLAWTLGALGAPAWMVGLLVPVRESGSMLPQLLIAARVRARERRKPVWLLGALLQAGAVAGMAVGGLLWWRGDEAGPVLLGALLAVAAGCWVAAAAVYAGIREQSGSTEGGANGLDEALRKLKLLREEPAFGRFVLARGLLLVSALSAPFLVLLARDHGFDGAGGLPVFLVAAGEAGWAGWVLVALFFALGVAHDGVRLGRKTYLVDLAGGNKRTDYVAVSNTVMGALLLATGALTGAVSTASVPAALGLLAAMGLAGAWLCRGLPEVQRD